MNRQVMYPYVSQLISGCDIPEIRYYLIPTNRRTCILAICCKLLQFKILQQFLKIIQFSFNRVRCTQHSIVYKHLYCISFVKVEYVSEMCGTKNIKADQQGRSYLFVGPFDCTFIFNLPIVIQFIPIQSHNLTVCLPREFWYSNIYQNQGYCE